MVVEHDVHNATTYMVVNSTCFINIWKYYTEVFLTLDVIIITWYAAMSIYEANWLDLFILIANLKPLSRISIAFPDIFSKTFYNVDELCIYYIVLPFQEY